MKRAVFAAVMAAAAVTFGASVDAQKTTEVHPGKAGSPHVQDSSGRSMAPTSRSNTAGPRSKGARPARTSIRTTAASGALALTKRRRSRPTSALKFGALSVPAGTYTLYTIPTGGTWHLVVSKKTGQWGIPYPKGEDLGRAPMTLGKAPAAAEQLTISVQDTPAGAHAPHRLGHQPRFAFLSPSARHLHFVGSNGSRGFKEFLNHLNH